MRRARAIDSFVIVDALFYDALGMICELELDDGCSYVRSESCTKLLPEIVELAPSLRLLAY